MKRLRLTVLNALIALSLLLFAISAVLATTNVQMRLVLKPGGGSVAGPGPLGIWLNAGSEGIGITWSTSDVREGIIMPLWLILIASAILPVAALSRRLQRARRQNHGSCPICNYDLRATPTRCPECGTLNSQQTTPH